jgi:hypothetical protein
VRLGWFDAEIATLSTGLAACLAWSRRKESAFPRSHRHYADILLEKARTFSTWHFCNGKLIDMGCLGLFADGLVGASGVGVGSRSGDSRGSWWLGVAHLKEGKLGKQSTLSLAG